MALYGAEIWGWKNETRLDRIKRKYVKWILGLDRKTPNYILIEETKMIEIRIEATRRAIIYEEKARNSGKKLVVECIKDLEKVRTKKEEGKWEAVRGDLLKRIGIDKEEIKCGRERGKVRGELIQEIVTVLIKIWRKEEERRRKKIKESKYNIYEGIITENLPKYLTYKEK